MSAIYSSFIGRRQTATDIEARHIPPPSTGHPYKIAFHTIDFGRRCVQVHSYKFPSRISTSANIQDLGTYALVNNSTPGFLLLPFNDSRCASSPCYSLSSPSFVPPPPS